MISESGVILIGETGRSYPLIARESAFLGCQCSLPYSWFINYSVWGEERELRNFSKKELYQNLYVSDKTDISKELNIVQIFCQSFPHHSSPGVFQTDFNTKMILGIKYELSP